MYKKKVTWLHVAVMSSPFSVVVAELVINAPMESESKKPIDKHLDFGFNSLTTLLLHTRVTSMSFTDILARVSRLPQAIYQRGGRE